MRLAVLFAIFTAAWALPIDNDDDIDALSLFENSSADDFASVSLTELVMRRSEDCTDPTFGTSQWANYGNDGRGQYKGSCGASGHNKDKCWTDVYAVQAQTWWAPWQVVSAEIDCNGFKTLQSCQISDIHAFQSCRSKETSVSVSVGIEADILKVGGEVTKTTGSMDCQTHTTQQVFTW